MTCIVGLVAEDGRIYMGADSAATAGSDRLHLIADPKVFKNGEAIVGICGSFRMAQLLRYQFTMPDHPDGMDVMTYMVTRFIEAVRHCFREHGFATKQNEQESGGTFLVGYRGRLFAVESSYQLIESRKPFYAIGCGQGYAIGAMDILHTVTKITPTDRVLRALLASETHNPAVRRPFILESI